MWVADHSTDLLKDLRIVTRDDFYDKNGHKVYPETFYIHGFHREDVIEEHKPTGRDYDWGRWKPFTQSKRMYVKK